MLIDILSLFPDYFKSPFEQSIIGRAQKRDLVTIRQTNIRDFSKGKYKQVDDRPYGGGAGMVLMPEPVVDAVRSVKQEKSHVVYLSPRAKVLTAKKAKELAQHEHLVLLCGHYEGIDQRAIDLEVDEEISIGPYVLTNGCIAAIVLVDATIRFIPGVIGNEEAALNDSFENGMLDWDHYTRPEIFEELYVPNILLSGHHQEIEKWRKNQAQEKTKQLMGCHTSFLEKVMN